MLATIVGTTNRPVADLFQDETGMRRFVQLDVKPRHAVPNWKQEVEDFDWLGLWQSVDHLKEVPLEPFMDELRQQQEKMRVKNRVEQFLEQFEPHQSHKTTRTTDGGVQYAAKELFKLFREFEDWACSGGQKMGFDTFQRRLQPLVRLHDDDHSKPFQQWFCYHPVANRCLYTYTPPNVIHLSEVQRA